MRLSVNTPRGSLVDTEVDEVTAPGELGEFGVLAGHVPLMSALKPGVLWYKGKDRSGIIAVGPGFLQVAQLPQADEHQGGIGRDRVLVLVDQAMTAGDVDRASAEKELAAAEKELAAWTGEIDGAHEALVVRRGWAQARIDAVDRTAAH